MGHLPNYPNEYSSMRLRASTGKRPCQPEQRPRLGRAKPSTATDSVRRHLTNFVRLDAPSASVTTRPPLTQRVAEFAGGSTRHNSCQNSEDTARASAIFGELRRFPPALPRALKHICLGAIEPTSPSNITSSRSHHPINPTSHQPINPTSRHPIRQPPPWKIPSPRFWEKSKTNFHEDKEGAGRGAVDQPWQGAARCGAAYQPQLTFDKARS